MKATRMETGFLIQPENNREEIALMSFLSEHKPVSYPRDSTEDSDVPGTAKYTAPQVHSARTSA